LTVTMMIEAGAKADSSEPRFFKY